METLYQISFPSRACLDGCLVTPSSYLGVQYLGERRVLKVVSVTKYANQSNAKSKPDDLGDLRLDMSQLSLDGSETVQNGDDCRCTEVDIYKVSVKSKFKITERLVDGGSAGSAVFSSPLGFQDVGGLEKQIQLLRELILHPLQTPTANGS